MISFVSVTSRVGMGSLGVMKSSSGSSLRLKTVHYSARHIFCLCFGYQKITR